MADFRALPRNSAVRKINELVKRARLAKVHACLIGHLQAEMPSLMGKEKKQRELTENLAVVFRSVQKAHGLPPGDFPNLDEFKAKLSEGYNFAKFPKLKNSLITSMDEVLARDIPELMAHLPKKEEVARSAEAGGFGSGGGAARATASKAASSAAGAGADSGNPFAVPPPAVPSGNPFGDSGGGMKGPAWVVAADKARYDELFATLGPTSGKLSGTQVMGSMQATGCDTDSLRMIWELSDVDKDQFLDAEEFALAMWLCSHVADGNACPTELEPDMVPPTKR